jgi:hypothetical protein
LYARLNGALEFVLLSVKLSCPFFLSFSLILFFLFFLSPLPVHPSLLVFIVLFFLPVSVMVAFVFINQDPSPPGD